MTRPVDPLPPGAVVLVLELLRRAKQSADFLDALWEDANGASRTRPVPAVRRDRRLGRTRIGSCSTRSTGNAVRPQVHRAAPYLKRVGAGLETWLAEPAKMVVATPV